MKKKGQVTLFFIIGIIILVLVGAYFAVKLIFFQQQATTEFVSKGEIPAKIKPINDYLESCLKNKLSSGADIISQQGGYIDIPTDYMPTSAITPVGTSLEIVPGSSLKTALWFREKGNGLQQSSIPGKSLMESELESYINKRFLDCIGEIVTFKDQGYKLKSPASTISSKVVIFDGEIDAQVKFPIQVSYQDISFTLDNYNAKADSQLGRLYNIAVQIMQKENEGLLFENKTINTLVAYDPEIPFASLDTFCGDKSWSKSETISKLKSILEMNIAALKVKNTNYNLPDNYQIMELDMLNSKEKDLTINFMYSRDWPTFIDIGPSKGDKLTSESFSSSRGGEYMQLLTQFMCLNSYQFIYTIKYPLLIMITDENGNSFSFAAEVIIDNNQPRKSELNPSIIEDTASIICEFPTAKINVGTYTYDKNGNNVPLNNVNILFKCGQTSCPIGIVQKGAQAELNTPSCFNALIVGKKDGFYEGRQLQTIKPEGKYYTDLYLEPIYKKKIKLKIIDKFSGEIRNPYESENALIQFSSLEKNYNANFIYPEDKSTDLIAGQYSIKATLFRNTTWPITTQTNSINHCITTPEASILGAFGLAKETKCEKIEIPSMELNQVATGGEEFNYTLERQYLADTSSLIIYAMADNIPSNMEEFADIQTKMSINSKNPLFRYPEYE